MAVKKYRIDAKVGDLWTDRISIVISATQKSTAICQFN
jgi:hypothetical protein